MIESLTLKKEIIYNQVNRIIKRKNNLKIKLKMNRTKKNKAEHGLEGKMFHIKIEVCMME